MYVIKKMMIFGVAANGITIIRSVVTVGMLVERFKLGERQTDRVMVP